MGISKKIYGLFSRKSAPLVPRDDGFMPIHSFGDPSTSAVQRISSVHACVSLISGTISAMPLHIYRKQSDGYRDVFDTHPLYSIIHDSPNYDQTSVDFMDAMCRSLELHGNAYASKKIVGEKIIALRPLHPQHVVARRLQSGTIEYQWTEDGRKYSGTERDVLHIRGSGGDALGGASVLSIGAATFANALSVETASKSFFEKAFFGTGIFKMGPSVTAEQLKTAKQSLRVESFGVSNSGNPMVLPFGIEYQNITISSRDAQMLETRAFFIEDICRIFGVPPAMIGHSGAGKSGVSSHEQQVLHFYKFTLLSRIARIEKAMTQQLLSPAERASGVSIRFNFEALLRGDSMSQAQHLSLLISSGIMTINEAAKRVGVKPKAGGDVVWRQMQDIPLSEEKPQNDD